MFAVIWPDFGEPDPPEEPEEPDEHDEPEDDPDQPEENNWRVDYETVNSPVFLDAIVNPPTGRVKLRWAGGDVFHPTIVASNSRIWLDGGALRASYWGNDGWEPQDVGVYANLYFVMQVDGRYVSEPVLLLRRPENNKAFSFPDIWRSVEEEFGRLPESGSLAAWWVGNLTGDIRVDLHPWRYGVDYKGRDHR